MVDATKLFGSKKPHSIAWRFGICSLICFLIALAFYFVSERESPSLGLILCFQMAGVFSFGLTFLAAIFELPPSIFQGDYRKFGYVIGGMVAAITVPTIVIAIDANSASDSDLQYEDLNRGRQIGLAMQNFESSHRHFPPIADGAGEGLSWRVHLLPFLEENDLYERFKLHEAWNSPHNIQLLEEMPDIYKSVSAASQPPKGKTLWMRPYGNGAFSASIEDEVTFEKIKDNGSDTIMVLQAGESSAVEWTRPRGYPFNPKDPGHGLRENKKLIVGFSDGSTARLDVQISDAKLKAMLTRSGGEEVEH